MDLTKEKIITYRVGSPPLTRKETFELLKAVPGWSLDNGHLTRTFTFESSSESLSFINEAMGFSRRRGTFRILTSGRRGLLKSRTIPILQAGSRGTTSSWLQN